MTEHRTVPVHFKALNYFERATLDVKVLRLRRKRVLELNIYPSRGKPLTITIRPLRAYDLANKIVDALEEGTRP